MLTVFNFFSNLFYKFKLYFFIALGIIVWILQIKWDARKKAKKEVIDSINKETQRVRDEWSKIDNSDVSIDDAINGLRKHKRKD